MATSTQRSVKRTAAKAAEKIDFVARFERDKRITGGIAQYREDMKAPEAMLTFMSTLVAAFADTPSYAAAVEDKKAMDYLVKQERDARMEGRRDKNLTISARDKHGSAATDFRGVLKFACHKGGGLKGWNKIVAIAGNWTMAKRLANSVRTTILEKDKSFPNEGKLATLRNKLRSGNGSETTTSLKVYVERAQEALSQISKLYAAKVGLKDEAGRLIAGLITLQSDIKDAQSDKASGKARKSRVKLATSNGKRIAA